VQDRVHVHDLHATILHLLGLDHEKLTYRHAGRDYRLTDVAASIDLTNATLSVRPRGAIYRVPDIAVDNYFSSDTILVKT